jgi:hypothetical protein
VLVTADDDQRIVIELPTPVIEGSGPHLGWVLLALPPSEPLTVTISPLISGQLLLPETVTVPAGQTFASFTFAVADDSFVNLTRSIIVTASAPNATSGSTTVVIHDDEPLATSLSLPPQLVEGQSPVNNATFSIDRMATAPLTVSLAAAPANEVSLPATVTVPAGQTQVVFTARAVDDNRIDGNLLTTVTATAPAVPTATAQTTAVDNETRTLSLNLPLSVVEGSGITGTVTISGTLTTALVVQLASSDEANLQVPPNVTIPAGAVSAAFTATAPDNSTVDGSRNVTITATAETFTTATRNVTVRDNEVVSYKFNAIAGIVNVNAPVNASVSAADVEGNLIAGFVGDVSLALVMPDGSTRAVTPSTVTISGDGWVGTLTLPTVSAAPLKLRATDASGRSGESAPFDVMRVLNITAGDLAWDAARGRLYASVPTSTRIRCSRSTLKRCR